MESQPQNPEFRIDPENFHPYPFSGLFQLSCYAIGSNYAFLFLFMNFVFVL